MRVTGQRIERHLGIARVRYRSIGGRFGAQLDSRGLVATGNRHRGVVLRNGAAVAFLALFAVFAIRPIKHHANAVAIADNLEPALVGKFLRFAREITAAQENRIARDHNGVFTALYSKPLPIHAKPCIGFALHVGLVALVFVGTFREFVFGIDNIHAHMVYLAHIFDRIATGRKEHGSNGKRGEDLFHTGSLCNITGKKNTLS